MKFKRCALLLILLSCLVLSGCGGPESTYKSAQALLAKGEYAEASEKFESIGSYEDASTLTMYCKACALCESNNFKAGLAAFEMLGDFKDCSYRINYYEARAYEHEAGTDNWEYMLKAYDIYQQIPVYLDSAERSAALLERVYSLSIATGEKEAYSDGVISHILALEALATYEYKDSAERCKYYRIRKNERTALDENDPFAMRRAADRYTLLGDFLDCEERAEKLNKMATPLFDDMYVAAVALMNAGKYEEAIAAFTEIEMHKDSAEQIKACETAILDGEYNTAMALMNNGQYVHAYKSFMLLNGYKDSKANMNAILKAYPSVQYHVASVGDYITFGTYEQDTNTRNGKENIEWLVLAKINNRLLVISRYALDCKPYNVNFTSVTWQTCTLRKWLNNDFLQAAFSSTEQAMIPTVTVSADKHPVFSTDPGITTYDKVFLLSTKEAREYFKVNDAEQCKATAYATAQGAEIVRGWCRWWLRSPGSNQAHADKIGYNISRGGVISSSDQQTVNSYNVAVRPVLWIELPK